MPNRPIRRLAVVIAFLAVAVSTAPRVGAQTTSPISNLPLAAPSPGDVVAGVHGGTLGVGGTTSKFPISSFAQLPNGHVYYLTAFPNVYCNGVSDDTAGINAAFASLSGTNYVTVVDNSSSCTYSSTIYVNPSGRNNITFRGDNPNTSQLTDIASPSADTFDGIVINGGANVVVRDLYLNQTSGTPERQGCSVRVENVTNGEVRHMKILNAYKGICNGSDSAFTANNSGNIIRDNYITVLTGGTGIQDNADTVYSSGVNDFENNEVYGPTDTTSIGFKYPSSGGTDTIISNNNSFFNFGTGKSLITASSNEILQNVWSYNDNMDGSVVSGCYYQNTTGSNNNINEFYMIRQWCIGNGTTSSIPLVIEASGTNNYMSSINYYDSDIVEGGGTYCAFVQGWTNSIITGSKFKACNSSGTGIAGIDFAGTANTNDEISSNDFVPAVPWASFPLTNTVSISLANTHITIHDNKMSGTGGIVYSGSNAGNKNNFYNNDGFNPVGPQTAPTWPPSGTALVNPFPEAEQVCVSGGTVTGIAIGGTSTGLTSGCFGLPVNQSITPTYSATPSAAWFGS